MARGKRQAEPERGTKVVTVRLTEAEFNALKAEAAGHTTMSDLIRSRIAGRGITDPVALKKVAALVQLGHQLRLLDDRPGVSAARIAAVLDRIGAAIDELAPKAGR